MTKSTPGRHESMVCSADVSQIKLRQKTAEVMKDN